MKSARMNAAAVLLAGLVTLSVPVALIGTSVRLILLPAFLQIEYRMPAFPADPYGFSTADRVLWANHAWQYLVKPVEPAYLANLEFEDGSPVFNSREVAHMADVKLVVRGALAAWWAALVTLVAAGIGMWRTGFGTTYRRALRRGGWLTIGLAAFIGAIIAFGMLVDADVFWRFFVAFHGLFFEGDSWLFAYSDTLIRLFPIRFWQDTFLTAAVIVLGGGLALGVGSRERRALEDARTHAV